MRYEGRNGRGETVVRMTMNQLLLRAPASAFAATAAPAAPSR
jgi:hypothetical protein